MKNLVRVFFFIFAILLITNLFTSCKKDGIIDPTPDVTNPTTPNVTPSDNAATMMSLAAGGGMTTDSTNYCDCFEIFDGVNWDGTDDEIIAQLEAILSGLTDEQLGELFSPVCTSDGEVFTNSCVAFCNEVFDFQTCDDYDGGDDDWNECFSFVYPITVVLPNGANVAVDNDDELIAVIDDWYDDNPTSNEDPTLIYPVNVLLEEDGSSLTISDDDQLEDLFEVCEEQDDFDCFTFNWPLSIQFPDSSVVEINNFDEAEDLIDAWYDANPNVNEDVELVYPFDVTLADGTVQTINSEDEFDTFIEEECDGDWDGGCLVQDTSNALVQGVKKMKQMANTK